MNDLRHAFPGQETDEPVFIFVRPYWLAFVPTALIFIFLIAVSLLTQFSIAGGNLDFVPSDIWPSLILILGVFQLIAIVVFMISVFDFYYDIVLATDRELVDIDQEQLFFRRVARLNLEDVEDVTSTTQGFFQSTFNYGGVEIQTAGETRNFIIANIKQPAVVEAIISDLAAQAKSSIPEPKRSPEGSAKAVIEGKVITNPADLATLGAIDVDDHRFDL